MANQAYLDGGKYTQEEDIKTLFHRATQETPDVEAVVSLRQSPLNLPGIEQRDGETRLSWTFKELGHCSKSVAQRLTSLGMCKGTSIMVLTENCAEWALFIWAAIWLGCPFISVNPAVVKNVDELRHILRVVHPGTVVVQDEETAQLLEANAPEEISSAFVRVTLSPLKRPYVLEEQFPEHYRSQSQSSADTALKKEKIGWIQLPFLWPEKPEIVPFPKQTTKASFEDALIIGFTSGTTSLPKACPQSSENLKLLCGYAQGSRQRICQHGPPYHSIACFLSVGYWANGGTMVYPSPKFEVMASLDAVENEHCTVMICVPAMIKAFTMVPNISKRRLGSLNQIGLSAAPVFSETVQLCRDVLGIKNVTVNWGMSENAAPLCYQVPEKVEFGANALMPVGKPVPGMKVKVCAPDSREPLSRGVEGELHTSGVQVIRGYVNASNDIFYEDEDGRWLLTGDMASMDDDGNVTILGRYKDIIIRGGANISPATVERKLNTIPGVDAQVIGVPDEMAGEVPVAIVKLQGQAAEDPKATVTKLQQLALHELGPKLAPAEYVDLQKDLQIQIYPTSTSGKVKKAFLKSKVLEFLARKKQVQDVAQLKAQPTEDILCELWSQVSGVTSETIDRNASVFTFVDSITTMRLSGAVRKCLGKDISVADIVKNQTIRDQAQLLDSRGTLSIGAIILRPGPPTAQDMAHCAGDESTAVRTQELATPLLSSLGLSWTKDVEDIIPAPDMLTKYLRGNRPQSWNHRGIYIARNTSHDELVQAWKAALAHHPIMRSLVIDYLNTETQLLLTLRGTNAWWSCSTFPNLTVSTPEELRSTLINEWADSQAGPLIRAGFVNIKSNPQDSALIFLGNHGVFDILSGGLFLEDLTTAVKNKLSLVDVGVTSGHTPFKDYADVYHLNRTGPAAQEAIDFHANRLKGVGKLTSALWPNQRAPGWFQGTDSRWRDADGNPGDPDQRTPVNENDDRNLGLDGLTRTVEVPGLPALREKYGIPPHIIFKAAVTLFNVHRTGSSTALFTNVEAARHWPFTSDWASENQELPNPLNIAGPTVEFVVNRIEVPDNDESVLSFLQRIHKDQIELSANSHVPLRELFNSPSLSQDDVSVIREVMNRQLWNWPASIQSETQASTSPPAQTDTNENTAQQQPPSLETLTGSAYDDVGVAWMCGLQNQETFYLNASYDDCQLSKDEVYAAMGEVLSVAAWLVQTAEGSSVGDAIFDMAEGAVTKLLN
ncbi:NRPS [Arachnomyces sp. PD_36]|nr:NRPS [Arachnomyces sp. PD_36]